MEKKRLLGSRLFRMIALTVLTVFLCGLSATAAEEVALKQENGSLIYTGMWDSDTTVYHRFTVSKPSLVTVTGARVIGSSTYSLSTTLCDSKKRPLEKYASSVNVYSSSDSLKYRQVALVKGTYYIMTSGASTYVLSATVNSKLGNVSVTDPGGASKKKAKTLKAKKNICGLIGVGEKAGKADWFKFTVKKSKVLTFTIDAAGNSGVKFTLYGPSFKKGIAISNSLKNNKAIVQTVKTRLGKTVGKLKVKPGTYYIKICRSALFKDKTYSALYTIKWK